MEYDRNMMSPTESIIQCNFGLEHSGADLSKGICLLGKYVYMR